MKNRINLLGRIYKTHDLQLWYDFIKLLIPYNENLKQYNELLYEYLNNDDNVEIENNEWFNDIEEYILPIVFKVNINNLVMYRFSNEKDIKEILKKYDINLKSEINEEKIDNKFADYSKIMEVEFYEQNYDLTIFYAKTRAKQGVILELESEIGY